MKGYIEAETLCKRLYEVARSSQELRRISYSAGIKLAADIASDFPRAEVAPVIHAKWLNTRGDKPRFLTGECSYCRMVSHPRTKYCPNCGALMDGKE